MLFLVIMLLLFSGCGGLEVVPPVSKKIMPDRRIRRSLRESYQNYESLHFRLQGANFTLLTETAKICEEIYTKVMFDTNLLTFKPKENYLIIIYASPYAYTLETRYPLWSGGGTVTELAGKILPTERETKARTSIFTYESALSISLLAHEISHLIFNEFMAFNSIEEANSLRWLNEGLATYEELAWTKESERNEYLETVKQALRRHAIPFETMTTFKPFKAGVRPINEYFFKGERIIFTNIDLWYWQVGSVVGFLIEKQGQYNFFNLLNSLKQKNNLQDSFAEAYPGKWRALKELENEWKQYLNNL